MNRGSSRLRAGFLMLILAALASGVCTAAPPHSSGRRGNAGGQEAEIPNAWPKLTDAQQKDAVQELKNFADDAQLKLNRPLRSVETRYFLFCSDLPPREAQSWADLLDRMYVYLAQEFAVKPGENIWRGKALVFVFSQADDYRRYEREIAHTDPGSSAGMCHAFGNGTVRVAFYRQPDQLTFAHVLVHESVHGFLHRYRTPVAVPSWANEGLAEAIAALLVPQRGRGDQVRAAARDNIQAHGNDLQGFFTVEHIEGWQYPVAEMLCTFMIQANPHNYAEFINGIKDGLPWDQSLEQRFQAPVDRLIPVFARWLPVSGLKA